MIHDDDYKIFSFISRNDCMILDIGANAGYSVSSMYSAGVRCPIFSFEVNEIHRRNLEWIKKNIAPKYGFIYDYEILGLDATIGQNNFLMPIINRVAISALARMQLGDIHGFCKLITDYMENYFQGKKVYFSIGKFIASCDTLDSYIAKNPSKFTLPISAIKIDTEGMEYNILKGSQLTIQKFNPLILIEGNSLPIKELLSEQGYKMVAYHEGKLYFTRKNNSSNSVYIHEKYIDYYRCKHLIGNQ